MNRPSWFTDGQVVVSNAQTCGIDKDGHELHVFDAASGKPTDAIDNALWEDVQRILGTVPSATVQWVATEEITSRRIAVPTYYDRRPVDWFEAEMDVNYPDYSAVSLGDLIDAGKVTARQGHGSPGAALRTGAVPYIKVSDLRAGQVNINPTNRVEEITARKHWKGADSGLRAFDILTPTRTSKNIGDLSLLMPGQERVVLTKEILVLRPGPQADFDAFYLLWAMSLKIVRAQWNRVIFMQTNREDVGTRYREIMIPIAPSAKVGKAVSTPFRDYYGGLVELREKFMTYLDKDGRHHVYLSSAEDVEGADDSGLVVS